MNPKMQRPLPTTAFLKHCKTVFSGWTVLFMASGLRSVQSQAALVAPGALLGSSCDVGEPPPLVFSGLRQKH